MKWFGWFSSGKDESQSEERGYDPAIDNLNGGIADEEMIGTDHEMDLRTAFNQGYCLAINKHGRVYLQRTKR